MSARKKLARATSFLNLIYKKRPEHKANEAKQGEFINKLSKNRCCYFQRKVI